MTSLQTCTKSAVFVRRISVRKRALVIDGDIAGGRHIRADDRLGAR